MICESVTVSVTSLQDKDTIPGLYPHFIWYPIFCILYSVFVFCICVLYPIFVPESISK